MTDWKKVGKKLLFPPGWLIVLLTVISTAALTVIFINSLDDSSIVWVSALVYAAYALAAYSLTVVCAFCVSAFPKYFQKIKQRIFDNKFGNRYMTDAAYRTHFSLYISLTINLLYFFNYQSSVCGNQPFFGDLVPLGLVGYLGGVLYHFSGDEIFAASLCQQDRYRKQP